MHASGVNPQQALEMLAQGNLRYVEGKATRPHQDLARRQEVTGGQHPFAIVLTCSDSRVPPEILFDQGIGDLFIVRTAGNVADDVAMGSIEYAAEHLGSRLVVVLGHQKCGAVTAACQSSNAPGHIDSIVKAIQPAVVATKGQAGDAVMNATVANVNNIVKQIATSQPILAEMVKEDKIRVVGAIYSLDTGAVQVV